jgi:hypothetical protein
MVTEGSIKKPNEALLRLYEIGRIRGLLIEHKQTGTDTSDTFVTLTGSNNTLKGLWCTYSPYLDVEVGHYYVALIKQSARSIVYHWKEFEKKNTKELAEYKRLKAKFG